MSISTTAGAWVHRNSEMPIVGMDICYDKALLAILALVTEAILASFHRDGARMELTNRWVDEWIRVGIAHERTWQGTQGTHCSNSMVLELSVSSTKLTCKPNRLFRYKLAQKDLHRIILPKWFYAEISLFKKIFIE